MIAAETNAPQQHNRGGLEIPRHKLWNGPLVIPEKHRATRMPPGTGQQCSKCGRWWKGKCPCVYYKRTTNWIDVIQNEYALKAWDRRLVAYGMSQRPDLILAAAACKPPHDKKVLTQADKDALQAIADQAKDFAKGSAAATIGTSLHKLTERMDLGETLGFVPEPWPADLRAYQEVTKGIEWVDVESFRVHDEYKVGGTADRIGWYEGRLRIFDVKTGSDFWADGQGPAMQLAMYARSRKYDIATDTRVPDVADIDLNVAYVIHLPEGQGFCELIPTDVAKGWGACRVAKEVWKTRAEKKYFMDPEQVRHNTTFTDMAARATTLVELQGLWRSASAQHALTPALKKFMTERAAILNGEREADGEREAACGPAGDPATDVVQ
jgi:hypothetical protein